MRIAIARFNDRISPRFDCAAAMEIVEVDDAAVTGRHKWDIDALNMNWTAMLTQRGVDVLLCGGIRRCDFFELSGRGIRVYAGLAGPADALLQAFLDDRLVPDPPWTGGGGMRAAGGRMMPRGDGTGPLGKGPGTGRGQGRCGQGRGTGKGAGQGAGQGQGIGRCGQPRGSGGGGGRVQSPSGKRKTN